mmetsp:Transcript_7914/g.21640  ORF Transcript_7914/g.21640 Transcript_7914/m.21640 type:complete len:215 (-) Transcript_7914:1093-1737(-)
MVGHVIVAAGDVREEASEIERVHAQVGEQRQAAHVLQHHKGKRGGAEDALDVENVKVPRAQAWRRLVLPQWRKGGEKRKCLRVIRAPGDRLEHERVHGYARGEAAPHTLPPRRFERLCPRRLLGHLGIRARLLLVRTLLPVLDGWAEQRTHLVQRRQHGARLAGDGVPTLVRGVHPRLDGEAARAVHGRFDALERVPPSVVCDERGDLRLVEER